MNVSGKKLQVAFTYEVTPGVPTRYTVKTEHGTGDTGIEQATVPFHTTISIFDRKEQPLPRTTKKR